MSVPNTDLPTSILFCRLCQSLYRNPRTLPCLHSFCLDCLQHLAPCKTPEGEPVLPCPLCNQQAPLPPDGVPGLTCNDFLVRMCREYVGEVQKTLVSGRSVSPAGSVTRQGTVSPASVIAGRAPASHFHYPSSSQLQPSSSPTASPGGVQARRERALSPPHSPLSDSSVRSHRSSWGAGYGFQRTASPSSSPGYVSPSGLPSSPRHFLHTSSSPSEAVLQTARRLSSEALPSRGVGVQRRLSSTPQDVVRTWECLHRKLNSLQSASLQVTYSLETVNMAEANWHQRKQDLRRDVQRRSAQLQFFIKRQERLLLAALDTRKTDDSFNSAAEEARSELRTNLKFLMHEIDTLRSVLDLATDSEIMSLSTLLLSSKVSQSPVTMETPELRFIVPDDMSLEDLVGRDFGCLTSTPMSHTIFTPEDIQQELPEDPEEDDAFPVSTSTVNISSTASPTTSDNFENGFEDVAYIDDDEEEEVVVEETLELIDGKMQVVSKRSVPSSKKQRSTQGRHESDKERSKRGRATDIRRTVNSSTSAHTSKEDLSQPATRQGSEKSGQKEMGKEDKTDSGSQSKSPDQQDTIEKFQNLRESLKQKRRELLLNTSIFPPEGPPGMAHLLRGEKRVQSLDRSASMRDDMRRSFSPSAPKHSQEPSIAAPVIHTPTHAGPKDITEHSTTASTGSASGTVIAAPLMSTSLIFTASSASVADKSSRPVRRAISAASDRASKMEYLRETWRKRKELLMQNEGYIPTSTDKPEDGKSSTDASVKDNGGQGNGGEGISPPVEPKPKIKHSIRSRISHLKQVLKKNGKPEESPQQSKAGDKGSGNGSSSTANIITTDKSITPAHIAAKAAAEKKVLQTIESILMKNAPTIEADSVTKPALPSQAGLSDTSSGSKPSMLVKPCPREPPSAVPVSTATPPPLETLPEDEGKAAQTARKPGLRVTSPTRGDASKETLQQMRANIRQKKERWRSLSLN